MKMLNNVDLSTDPLGASLVAGDLPGITCQFSASLTVCLFSPHTLSFQIMMLCEMVSKPH